MPGIFNKLILNKHRGEKKSFTIQKHAFVVKLKNDEQKKFLTGDPIVIHTLKPSGIKIQND